MSSEEVPPGSYWSGYDVLWGLREPTRRTALDRVQIVEAAIEIADRDGLAAVTMRSVARALGSAPMSLYRHVPDKDALIAMMVDQAIGNLRSRRGEAPQPTDWRAGLEGLASSTWRLCRQHRWFPEASLARPPITPNGIAGFEFSLGLFDGFPIDIAVKARFVSTVYATVVSSAFSLALNEAARLRSQLSDEQLHAEGAPVIARIVTSGSYPRVSAFITQAPHLDDEAQMHASVELILDGIAARLAEFDATT